VKLTLTYDERIAICGSLEIYDIPLYELISECLDRHAPDGFTMSWHSPDDMIMTVSEKIAMKLFQMRYNDHEWPNERVRDKILHFLYSVDRYMLRLTLSERVNLHTLAYDHSNKIGILCDLITDSIWTNKTRSEPQWEGEYDIEFWFGYELAWSVSEFWEQLKLSDTNKLKTNLRYKIKDLVREVTFEGV